MKKLIFALLVMFGSFGLAQAEERILLGVLVEDNVTNGCWATPNKFILEATEMLEWNGFEVITATSVREMLSKLYGDAHFGKRRPGDDLDDFHNAPHFIEFRALGGKRNGRGPCIVVYDTVDLYFTTDALGFATGSSDFTTTGVSNALLDVVARFIKGFKEAHAHIKK